MSAAEAQSRSKTDREHKKMKARKITETYAVLSLREIRQLAQFAENSAQSMYGHAEPKHCVIVRGLSRRVDGKTQFAVETMCGAGREVKFTWTE